MDYDARLVTVAFSWFTELLLPDQGIFLIRHDISKHEIAKNIKGRLIVEDHATAKFANIWKIQTNFDKGYSDRKSVV